jgi:hypothetical protein
VFLFVFSIGILIETALITGKHISNGMDYGAILEEYPLLLPITFVDILVSIDC